MKIHFHIVKEVLIWVVQASVLSYFSSVQLFVTPWTVTCQAPQPMGFSRQESWSGLPCPPPEDLPDSEINSVQFSSVAQVVRLFVTPWTAAHQASLSITNPWSLLKLISIESVMPSNHLIFCHPLLLLTSIFPSIRLFSNESVLCIRWSKYWSFSFSISPSNEYSGLISFKVDWLDLLAVCDSQESSPTSQFKCIDYLVLSFLYSPNLTSIHDYWKNHSFDPEIEPCNGRQVLYC